MTIPDHQKKNIMDLTTLLVLFLGFALIAGILFATINKRKLERTAVTGL